MEHQCSLHLSIMFSGNICEWFDPLGFPEYIVDEPRIVYTRYNQTRKIRQRYKLNET